MTQHIRPTKRRPTTRTTASGVDVAEQHPSTTTQAVIQSWTKMEAAAATKDEQATAAQKMEPSPPASSPDPKGGEEEEETPIVLLPEQKDSTTSRNSATAPTLAASQTATSSKPASSGAGGGILRKHPKYSSGGNHRNNTEGVGGVSLTRQRPTILEDGYDDHRTNVPTVSTDEEEEEPAAVRDVVVERRRRGPPKTKPVVAAAASIEGYTPSSSSTPAGRSTMTTTAIGKSPVVAFAPTTARSFPTNKPGGETAACGGAAIRNKPTDDDDDDDDEPPLVFNSLADLMQAAGTLPEEPSETGQGEPPSMVEAELKFSCVDPTEFERQQEEVPQQLEELHLDDVEDEENVVPHPDMADGDDDDDDDGVEGLWGLLGGGDDDDESTEAVEPPPPTAFLQLWTALSLWVTPAAVAFVRHDRETSSMVQQQGHDDVSAARCAGLLAQLPTEQCWSELLGKRDTQDDLRATEQRLAELLRCFNYSRPVKLETVALYRALTCVLLDIVLDLPSADGVEDVPGPCRAVGMSAEEYRYLTRSAIANFGSSSEAVVQDSGLMDQ